LKKKLNSMKLHNFLLGPCDTDSISYYKPDGSEFTTEEQQSLLDEINTLMPDMVRFEHDGYYECVLVLKAKNYCLQKKGELTIKKKGASITDKKREPALLEMLDKLIRCLMLNEGDVHDIYLTYIKEAYQIKDIARWASKKSVTSKVLNGTRTNETKVLDAIGDSEVQEGDKIWVYSAIEGMKQDSAKGELIFSKKGVPKMVENCVLKQTSQWSGDEDKLHYVERVYKTLCILENVIDIPSFTKYHLKKNLPMLEVLCKE
jgi:hypothetical protein